MCTSQISVKQMIVFVHSMYKVTRSIPFFIVSHLSFVKHLRTRQKKTHQKGGIHCNLVLAS